MPIKKPKIYLILIFLSAFCYPKANTAQQELNLDVLKSRKPATFAQAILFNEAKKKTYLPKTMFKLINSTSAKIKIYTTANCATIFILASPNLDNRLFTLYHELGHIMNPARKQQARFSTDASFIEPITEIDYYLTMGQNVLDKSSAIGRLIKAAIEQAYSERSLEKTLRDVIPSMFAPITILETYIAKYLQRAKMAPDVTLKQIGQFAFEAVRQQRIFHPFWVQPHETDKLQAYLFSRNSEQYADLFALHKLFEHNHIQTILRWAEYFISCDNHTELCSLPELYITSETYPDGTQDKHPSNIERAIYIIGFLAAHGIDVNKALRDYEAHGICIDGENINAMLAYLKKQRPSII